MSSLTEVAVREDDWRDQCPQVQQDAYLQNTNNALHFPVTRRSTPLLSCPFLKHITRKKESVKTYPAGRDFNPHGRLISVKRRQI